MKKSSARLGEAEGGGVVLLEADEAVFEEWVVEEGGKEMVRSFRSWTAKSGAWVREARESVIAAFSALRRIAGMSL